MKAFTKFLLLMIANVFLFGCAARGPVATLTGPTPLSTGPSSVPASPAAATAQQTTTPTTTATISRERVIHPPAQSPTGPYYFKSLEDCRSMVWKGTAGKFYSPIHRNPQGYGGRTIQSRVFTNMQCAEEWVTGPKGVEGRHFILRPPGQKDEYRCDANGSCHWYDIRCGNKVYQVSEIFPKTESVPVTVIQTPPRTPEVVAAPANETTQCHSGVGGANFKICTCTCTARVNGREIAKTSFDLDKDFHIKCEEFAREKVSDHLKSIGKGEFMNSFVYTRQ